MDQLSKKEIFKDEINTKKYILAEKLKREEIDCDDLDDKEIDEMIEFFSKDIKEKDREIDKIKQEILEIKRKLNR